MTKMFERDKSLTQMYNNHLVRHERELDTLKLVCDVLGRHSGQQAIFTEVLHVLTEHLGFVRPTLMLVSADGSALVIEESSEPHNVEPQARYLRGEGVSGHVFHTGMPALIPSISRDPLFQNRIHRRNLQEDMSFICTPIILDQEVIGTLCTDLALCADEALQESHRVLAIVASLIANDVRNRRMAQMQKAALWEENEVLRDQLGQQCRPENMIGNSAEMQMVYRKIRQVAISDTTVLIRGESGTGKELVAAAIHFGSRRASKPFIKVNCAALSENLLESELFGHEKGAFTGAVARRIGRIEQAEGGTLFLDEIGDFSPAVQIKLLRVLQERQYERVGSNECRPADVRILAATNRDLEAACQANVFRSDFYYRINVFPIHIPPLRERRSDILLLVNYFVEKYAGRMCKTITRVSTNAINMLMAYHWPGNVRELENCLEYAVLVSEDGVVHGHSLPPTLQTPDRDAAPLPGTLRERTQMLEKDMIIDTLKRTQGSVAQAAELLGLSGRMVRYKIEQLGIDYKGLFRRGRKR